ncbi:hypothetical protein [Clostridioides difficile]|nr:hypothetical protein [Clostridioides difficile]
MKKEEKNKEKREGKRGEDENRRVIRQKERGTIRKGKEKRRKKKINME